MPDKTLEDRAAEALFRTMMRNMRKEFIGALLPDGTATPPQNTARARRQGSQSRAVVPANLEALYHNHPPGPENHRFSTDDVETAEKLGVPSFIAVAEKDGTPSGAQVRRFDPGDRTDIRGTSEGKPVLHQFPIEAWQDMWDEILIHDD